MKAVPVFVWYVACSVVLALTAVLIWLIHEYGISLVLKGSNRIVVAGKTRRSNTPLGRTLDRVQQWVPEIEHVFYEIYKDLMIAAGANPDLLNDYDDAQFAKMLFRYLVSGGNGSQSVQKLVENHVVAGEWKTWDGTTESFVASEIWPLIVRAVKNYLNAEYSTTALQKDGTTNERWVSATDLVEALTDEDTKRKTVEKIIPIFNYARSCRRRSCAD